MVLSQTRTEEGLMSGSMQVGVGTLRGNEKKGMLLLLVRAAEKRHLAQTLRKRRRSVGVSRSLTTRSTKSFGRLYHLDVHDSIDFFCGSSLYIFSSVPHDDEGGLVITGQ